MVFILVLSYCFDSLALVSQSGVAKPAVETKDEIITRHYILNKILLLHHKVTQPNRAVGVMVTLVVAIKHCFD